MFVSNMPLLKEEYHKGIYVLGLLGLAVTVTMSAYIMSLAQFLLMLNWFAEGNIKQKFKSFFQNKAALAFLGIYLLHVIGLLYTDNFTFAFADLRIKLPFLGLPIILATSPLISRKTIQYILLTHVAASFASSIVSVSVFYTQHLTDMRAASVFISHIRFSLNICLDIFILLYFVFGKNSFNRWIKAVFGLLIVWFVYFMLFMESFTGIIIVLIASTILLIVLIMRKTKIVYRIACISFLMIGALSLFFYFRGLLAEFHNIKPIDVATLADTTAHGHRYVHDIHNKITDNGNYTWMYVCEEELADAWNKRSLIKYDSVDREHQRMKYTLVRYLTSKGLRKDKDGVNALSDQEIKYIESGVANVNYIKKGSFENRIKNTIWEFENYKITHDPRGRSMIQRFELWRNSLLLIQKHLLFGVGTGDPFDVFTAELVSNHSLLKDARLRSHNQYFTITITFGILGLAVFLFCLIYPGIKLRKYSHFLFLSFFLIAMLSMLTEDTIESQAGATFFAFFFSFFLFVDKNEISE